MIRKLLLILSIVLALSSCDMLSGLLPDGEGSGTETVDPTTGTEAFTRHDAVISTPLDDEVAFIKYNGGKPSFTESDWNGGEYYIELNELDRLGRVPVVQGLFDHDHFPDEERGDIGSVTPTGWVNHSYDVVSGGYIYNRCHMLGHQFSGLNDDKRNLMTGTRFFNIEGMLTYENQIADHMKEEDGTNGEMHQVLVRTTPDFSGDNLLAHGIIYEADCRQCDDIDFCVYIYNKQPGITIDYRTGENWLNTDNPPEEDITLEEATYILNTNTDRFHRLDCSGAPEPDAQSYELTDKTREELIADGYSPCGTCNP